MELNEAEKQIKVWAKKAVHRNKELELQKKYLRSKLQRNPDVIEVFQNHFLYEKLFDCYLHPARHSQKRALNDNCIRFNKEQPPNQKRVSIETEKEFRKDLKEKILDEYACGGMNIGDLTRSEVCEEAEQLRAQGRGCIQQANIFMEVHKRMSGNKTVRECVSPITFINIVNKFKAISKIA